jgi:hypothetical protein
LDSGDGMDSIFIDHCFINSMRFFKIDEDTIEFGRDIIKMFYPLSI